MTKRPSFIRFGSPQVERVAKDISGSVVEGDPQQGVWLYSNDIQSGARFGIWESAAGRFRAKMTGLTEFCHILEGEAHVTDLSSGEVHSITVGDSFVMEAGFDGEWYVPKYVKKCFAISDLK